jgi:hypothetical protein
MADTHSTRRISAWLPAILVLILASCAGVPAEKPDWAQRGGSSEAFPAGRFLTGFAATRGGEDALESARQQAAADLARQISVQIESAVTDITNEREGRLTNDLTSRIRTTTDIRLEGVRFETWQERKQAWALAVLERLPAAVANRKQRDQALARTGRCLEDAQREEQAGRAAQALSAYQSCRTPLDEAIEREAVASALQRGGLLQDDGGARIVEYSSRIESRIRAIPHEDARSIRSAADALAVQLGRGGVGRGRRLEVAPFGYRDRDVSSPFGREVALALESAIGRMRADLRRDVPAAGEPARTSALVIRGLYRESGEELRLRATAREAGTARLLASAEVDLARSAVPDDLEIVPPNFDSFVRDADKLAGGEIVSGDLRLELRTNKGIRGLVYDEGEELGLYVRVNQPAWVRLIYVLTNGDHVPIDQAYYIDETKVNQLVEYPERFEIVPPFGVEMIHAMAYTEQPAALQTRPTRIEGQDYRVVLEGADQVVRQRGIARKQKREVAEQTVQLTTMPRTTH